MEESFETERTIGPKASDRVEGDPQLYVRMGKQIQRAREGLSWKQEELGARIGESVFTISRWENASRKPKAEDIDKLARALGKSVEYFFEAGPADKEDSRSPHMALLNRWSSEGKLSEESQHRLLKFAMAEIDKAQDD